MNKITIEIAGVLEDTYLDGTPNVRVIKAYQIPRKTIICSPDVFEIFVTKRDESIGLIPNKPKLKIL